VLGIFVVAIVVVAVAEYPYTFEWLSLLTRLPLPSKSASLR